MRKRWGSNSAYYGGTYSGLPLGYIGLELLLEVEILNSLCYLSMLLLLIKSDVINVAVGPRYARRLY